jgi:cytochrome P450
MKARNSKVAYTPFSIGSRACIGARLTISEALVIFAMLLQRADFELVDDRPPRATLRPRGEVPIRLHWRRA